MTEQEDMSIDRHTGLSQSTDILSIHDNKSNCSDVSDSVLDQQVINCLIGNRQKVEMDVDGLHAKCIKTSERLKNLEELTRSVMDDCKNPKVSKKRFEMWEKNLGKILQMINIIFLKLLYYY